MRILILLAKVMSDLVPHAQNHFTCKRLCHAMCEASCHMSSPMLCHVSAACHLVLPCVSPLPAPMPRASCLPLCAVTCQSLIKTVPCVSYLPPCATMCQSLVRQTYATYGVSTVCHLLCHLVLLHVSRLSTAMPPHAATFQSFLMAK